MKDVMAHCDLWAANLLWKKDGNDGLEVAAVIDFQSLKYSNGALDLLRIMMQLKPEDRRERWEEILETFYGYIKEDYGEEVPYTLEQLRKSFLRLFPLLGLCVVLGIGHFIAQVKRQKTEEAVPALLQKTRLLFEDIIKYNRLNKENKLH